MTFKSALDLSQTPALYKIRVHPIKLKLRVINTYITSTYMQCSIYLCTAFSKQSYFSYPFSFLVSSLHVCSLRCASVVQKLHHKIESNIRPCLGLRPSCSFRHLNRFEILTFVQLYGSRIIQITMQCNSTAIPAPRLSFCFCY